MFTRNDGKVGCWRRGKNTFFRVKSKGNVFKEKEGLATQSPKKLAKKKENIRIEGTDWVIPHTPMLPLPLPEIRTVWMLVLGGKGENLKWID